MDVVIRLSRELGRLGIYPTIDAVVSRSRLLEAGTLSQEHVAAAAWIREALMVAPAAVTGSSGLPTEAELRAQRSRKLQRFFAQPFFVAEPYTRRPGVAVGLGEALRGCREILDGIHDAVPEHAFYLTGGIADVLAAAERTPARERPSG